MEQQYPGSHYQPLRDLMLNEHNLALMHTELSDIIDVVRKMEMEVAVEENVDQWNFAQYSMNDKIGSHHWFNTLMSQVNNIGLYMKRHDKVDVKLLEGWGQQLNNIGKDMMAWFESRQPSPAVVEQEGWRWVNCSERMPNGFYAKFKFRIVEDKRPISIKDIRPKELHLYEWYDETPPVKEAGQPAERTKDEILDSIVRDWSTPITRQDVYEAMEQYARQGCKQPVDGPWKSMDHEKPQYGMSRFVTGVILNPEPGITNGETVATINQFWEVSNYQPKTKRWRCEINDSNKKVTHWMDIPPIEASADAKQEYPGPWKYEVHHVQYQEDADEYATISDGKVTLFIDGGEDDGDEQRVVNLLNQLKIKLDYDHSAEFVASELDKMYKEACEEIRRLREQEGLRWVQGEYEKLYQQVESGTRSVCYVDHYFSGEIIARDICTIKPRPDGDELDLSIRGRSYGSTFDPAYKGSTQCEKFVQMCTHLNVEWLKESNPSPASTKEGDINDAMIDAVYEDAEMWKQEYDDCRRILQELVTLKMVKDTEGKTPEYLVRQPLAWKAAIEFLNVYQHVGE